MTERVVPSTVWRFPIALASFGILLVSSAHGWTAPLERVFLRYDAEAVCPDRNVFVERFRSHSGLVQLVNESAPMVLDVRAGITERGAWGELRFGDSAGGGVARRVAGADCAEVVTGLILIAVVALDPSSDATPGGPSQSAEPSSSLLSEEPLSSHAELPAPQTAVSPPATTPRNVPRQTTQTTVSSTPTTPRNAPRQTTQTAVSPPATTPLNVSRQTTQTAVSPPATTPSRDPVLAHRHFVVSVAPGIGAEVRTPESPNPSLAVTLGGRIALERAWRPALGLGVGYSTSQWGDAGAGEARFTLWFTRVEICPHVVRWGAFEVGAYLGLEIGRLTGRYRSDAGVVIHSSAPASTGWWGLTQVVSAGYAPGQRFAVAARVGVIEPLRRDYFYLDRPHLDVHRIPSIGLMGGLVASCRFE